MLSPRIAWIPLGLVLAAGAGGPGCERAAEPPRRVLLIGIDGATWSVAGPLLRDGRLPHLARLAREGVSGRLLSFRPLESPRIWTSVATGKGPEKHGIESFEYTRDDGTVRLYASTDRRVHALWNIASQTGRSVGVVNWWTTFPPEVVRGVMVSDFFLAEQTEQRTALGEAPGAGATAYPPGWSERLAGLVEAEESPVPAPDPFRHRDALPAWIDTNDLARVRRIDDSILRLALAVEDAIAPDLLMVFFPGIDRVSHRLWGFLEPPELYPEPLRGTAEQRRIGADALRDYYDYTDALIGRLLERFDAEALVMVVSDHGFEAGVEMGFLTGRHWSPKARFGVVFGRGPGIAPGTQARDVTILDITPTILTWWRLPVADDMDGRPASFLDASEPDRIATWDTQPIERLDVSAPREEEVLREELRALGYVE